MKPNYIEFSNPRVVALYDLLNAFGDDSEFFCNQAKKQEAKIIIDLGCGTGILTIELAKQGYSVIGIEPSEAMLDVARIKPYADKVHWIKGGFEKMEGMKADMILMTSHVAQFFLRESEWQAVIQTAHRVLNAGGHFIFDIRRLTNPIFPNFPTKDNL